MNPDSAWVLPVLLYYFIMLAGQKAKKQSVDLLGENLDEPISLWLCPSQKGLDKTNLSLVTSQYLACFHKISRPRDQKGVCGFVRSLDKI